MKKQSIVLLACAGLVVFGSVLAFCGWMLGSATGIYWADGSFHLTGGRVDPNSGRQVESRALEPFERVKIDAFSEDVTLIASDHFGVDYDLASGSEIQECDVKNGELRFDVVSRGINFGINVSNSHVTIYYPRGTVFTQVQLDTVSGGVRADDLDVAGELSIYTTSGDVSLKNPNVGTFSASTVSGTVRVEGLTADSASASSASGDVRFTGGKLGTVNLKTTSGVVALSNTDAQSVTLDSSSGDFWGDGTIREGLQVETISGQVRFTGNLRGDSKIQSSSGDVRLTTNAPKDEFSYDLRSTSGDRRVDGQDSDEGAGKNAKYHLNIETTSGDIGIEFGK